MMRNIILCMHYVENEKHIIHILSRSEREADEK
jgi:hypothetical protein